MILTSRDGRNRSINTRKERWESAASILGNLNEDELLAFYRISEDMGFMSKAGDTGFDSREEIVDMSNFYHELSANHYDGKLVSTTDFIENDKYLGVVGRSLYPKWKADYKDLFKGKYTEAIISGSIGCGKCLDGETEFISGNGKRTTLKKVVDGGGKTIVPSFDKVSGRTTFRSAIVKNSGFKILGTLVLNSGKEIRLSPDHPVLTPDGWIKIEELKKGDLIATSRELPGIKNKKNIGECEIEFVSFMLADGACSSGNWSFSNANIECLERFEHVSKVLYRKEDTYREPGVTIREEKKDMKTLYPRGTKWIQKKYNLYEKSINKRFPDLFVDLNDRQLGLFLNRFISCDGHLRENVIEVTLGSVEMVKDISLLLLRFGIHSRMKKVKKWYSHNGKRKWSWAWRLSISGADNLILFFDKIGFLIGKREDSLFVYESAKNKKNNSNVDITPVDTGMSNFLRKRCGVPSKEWKKYRIPRSQKMGHGKLQEIKENYGLPDELNWWTDVFWDRVKEYKCDKDKSPVYDVEVPGTKNFSPNGIIVHNTTFAEICLLRMFYEVMMLKDPQSSFGLMPGTEIVFVCFNRDDKLARDVTYGGVRSKLEQSPFFSQRCKIGNSETIVKGKGIRLMAVSVRSAKALGRNVFGGIIDETDFLEGSSISGKERAIGEGEKPFAEQLHSSIMRRMKSRYETNGFLPGKLFMSSSAKNKESFTNKRISDSKNNPSVFCRDYALYDVKPAEKFSKTRFWVLVGNGRIRHKILTDHEYESISEERMVAYEEEGVRFLHVPDNFRPDFESNIEDSIRDIGGCVTVSASHFIQLRERIYEAVDPTLSHPARDWVWETGTSPGIIWSRLVEEISERLDVGIVEKSLVPRRDPGVPRHVHIDLSLGKKDRAGICIGHTVDMVDVERRTEDGHLVQELAPLIEIDLLMQIKAPPNGEIDIGSVRGLVYHFKERGFSFNFASMDNYQSAESLQKFRQQGIPAEKVSVDTKYEPYDYLKLAIYEGRLIMYEYPIVLKELENLQNDVKKGMVDHPPNGSKDCADALAGVVYSLSTRVSARAPIEMGAAMEEYEQDDEWVRQTMHRKGKKAPIPVGNTPTSGLGGGPLILGG